MLLFELIQVKNTEQNIDQHDTMAMKKSYVKDIQSRAGKSIGAYGKYDRLSSEPKMGIKTSIRDNPEDKDAYYQYIKAVSQVSSENPFFPRVYDIKTIRDKNNRITYDIKIEHLNELNSLSKEELFRMAKRLFVNVDVYGFDSHTFGAMVRDAAYGKKDIRDENLKDAIQLINYIRKKYDFENDINWKNIMIRRTNLGYQLVITDPLS